MNQKRRKKLREIKDDLEQINGQLMLILDEEQDSLDNWPESLEGTERYRESEDACDALSDAVETIRETSEIIENVITGNL